MKNKKLLTTLRVLGIVPIIAPIVTSCSNGDGWIDASVNIDPIGFEKMKGQELWDDEATFLYYDAIVDDNSILENDMKWGFHEYYERFFNIEEAIHSLFKYKISNLIIDPETANVSYNYSVRAELKSTDSQGLIFTYANFDIEFNKMPLIIDYYSNEGLYACTPQIGTEYRWADNTYAKVNGYFFDGREDDKGIITPNTFFSLDNTTITKNNYSDYASYLYHAYWCTRFFSYYLSDCKRPG